MQSLEFGGRGRFTTPLLFDGGGGSFEGNPTSVTACGVGRDPSTAQGDTAAERPVCARRTSDGGRPHMNSLLLEG
jgi:hypothetical protein